VDMDRVVGTGERMPRSAVPVRPFRLRSRLLTRRLHIDLLRVCSASVQLG